MLPVRLDLIAMVQPAVCFSRIRQRNLHRIQTLLYAGQGFFAIMYIAVLWIRIRDSRSGTFLTPGSQTDIFESLCSATVATNSPSLRDSPNGCQGHPRPCLSPPDRLLVTEPDSNDVLTRSTFYSTIGIDDIKCTKRLKPENRKDPYK